ncbi:MAG: ADP-ribosylglycohydrolase family protein [Clostridiales bacterium]|nr:ADP-ribosylglycohydrolase family protein [Clostridiales bacterium]
MDKTKLPDNISAIVTDREKSIDRIRGCLIGGAAGDALGYKVEFVSYDEILRTYGPSGITSYAIDPASGKALFSDDTQMSLFTANGLLCAQTRVALHKLSSPSRYYVYLAYLDWLETQRGDTHGERISWLLDVKELWSCRAPGATCLDALSSGEQGSTERRINHSKGCGGVMRVAPVGIALRDLDDRSATIEGAEIAALTHSHSLGFMPAAFLTYVIKKIISSDDKPVLREVVREAQEMIRSIFSERKHLGAFMELIDRAVALSCNQDKDEDHISRIGAGWCGDEALAIAIYCALRHSDDFSAAIISAVNHSGDSDSTGSITGNIIGALLGYDAIDEKWKDNLELKDTILEIADDLCYGCLMSADDTYTDESWLTKYARFDRK